MSVGWTSPLDYKAFWVKDLQRISVIGLGLLGGSVALAIRRCMPGATVVGYSHREATRRKARDLAVATEVADDLATAVSGTDLIILATPIFTFEKYFADVSLEIPSGCIVTDVGSTKTLPHRWAERLL